MAACTRSCSLGLTRFVPRMTLGTVAMETEARLATSTIVDMYLRLHVVKIEAASYLLDSGRPNRLWFLCCLRIGMNNLIQGYGIDCDGLLREPEKELTAAL